MTLLVTVAHGTRTAAGNEVAREVTARAAARLGLAGVAAYVELAEPLLSDVAAGAAGRSEGGVVVPLLLSTGMHVRSDLPQMVAGSGLRLGRQLGPHPLLASAMVARLISAGAAPGSPVVMVAAGSTDPLAVRDLERSADLLGRAWGGDVRWATLTGLGPRPADVVRPGDAVAPYLLATGYFDRRLRTDCLDAGAALVADVIGPHPLVVDLVVSRARALVRARSFNC
ncbi:sirohydrochlorin chelatase [Nocardioides abyssi]|uniref:CbiX/SirB N-terminal domain-containing protein n=1 Tax=Nocardioides abyssi TaxID=3058370 RepID=A0ABT8ETI1_9ACTN|nr:CbiX/SirB N-terminal domain-containing protein [Nocardioides abyssi]MDN4161420.1 CbiX/SirB N-terminal domain-containing protein [Nocardioides abyssi]